ncbi:MAG: beta-lactamase family protein [Bacteroidales bacterium]|nr:beta-lactamase family protein [Bacteroidales bacterium]
MVKILKSILITLIIFHFKCYSQDQNNEIILKKINGKTISSLTLDKTIPIIIDSADITGISIAVINDSKIKYIGAFGIKSIITNEAINQNTKFEAASLTKPILAFTAMKLVEEGKLELDRPLYQYLEYDDIKEDERYKLITTRIVLNHTSGLPNWRWKNPDKKLNIKFTPGKKYSYSGEAYVYLQKVIEKVMGKRLDEVVKEKVFEPLEMNNTSLVLKRIKNCAIGHTQNKEVQKKWQPKNPNGASSLHTTANDYAKFLIAILNHQGLSEKSINEMLSPQVSISKIDSTLFWGLGFGLELKEGNTFFWHWGDNDVFRAFTIVSKEKKMGVIYFTNSMNGLSIFKKITQLTLGGDYSIYSWLNYIQYNSPEFVIPKTIIKAG